MLLINARLFRLYCHCAKTVMAGLSKREDTLLKIVRSMGLSSPVASVCCCFHLCVRRALKDAFLRSAPGIMLTVNGKKALNMVSSNFLGVAGDPKIQVEVQSSNNPTETYHLAWRTNHLLCNAHDK